MLYYLAFIEFGFPMVCKILQILVRDISRARMALLRELHIIRMTQKPISKIVLQSTLALRTPRYNEHPDKTDSS